jgi:hypothetical protein
MEGLVLCIVHDVEIPLGIEPRNRPLVVDMLVRDRLEAEPRDSREPVDAHGVLIVVYPHAPCFVAIFTGAIVCRASFLIIAGDSSAIASRDTEPYHVLPHWVVRAAELVGDLAQ